MKNIPRSFGNIRQSCWICASLQALFGPTSVKEVLQRADARDRLSDARLTGGDSLRSVTTSTAGSEREGRRTQAIGEDRPAATFHAAVRVQRAHEKVEKRQVLEVLA